MRRNNIFSNIKDNVCDCLRASKVKCLILAFVLLVSLLTGIIVAVRCHNSPFINGAPAYGVVDISGVVINSSFFTRLLSMILVLLLLLLFSLSPFCMPLAFILLAYRTYLLGLNLCLMFMLYGFSGVIASFLIALPCQLLALIIFYFYYICLSSPCNSFCSGINWNVKLKILAIAFICLFVASLFESMLLVIFNVNVILVI